MYSHIYLSIYLSIYLFIYLSIYLLVYFFRKKHVLPWWNSKTSHGWLSILGHRDLHIAMDEQSSKIFSVKSSLRSLLPKASNLSMIPRWKFDEDADSSTSGPGLSPPLSTGAFFTGGFFTGVFLAVTAGDLLRKIRNLLRSEKRNLPTVVRTSVPASSRYSKNTSRRGASNQRWNRI